jgi:hypothetical protein
VGTINNPPRGFATALWTAERLGQLIERRMSVTFNLRFPSAWRRNRGFPESATASQLPSGLPPTPESKRAWRQKANVALIDESELLMAPLVRRTWAPRGGTPRLAQRGDGGPREQRVSDRVLRLGGNRAGPRHKHDGHWPTNCAPHHWLPRSSQLSRCGLSPWPCRARPCR